MKNKINKREALKGVSHTRLMSVKDTPTVNAEDTNTLDFVFISSDNAGTRYDWYEDEYYTEQLDIVGANTKRLNTFFKDHSRSTDSASGKITNVRTENNELIGSVTFGSNPDSQVLLSKYREGILTDVSIGYEINDYTVEKRGASNEQDIVTVTNFDIFEVSAVGLGFDSGAKKRSNNLEEDDDMNKDLLERLAVLEAQSKRSEEEKKELATLRAKKVKVENDEVVRLKAENKEMKRVAEIKTIADSFGERGARVLKDNDSLSADAFRAKLLADFAGEKVEKIPSTDNVAQERSKMINAIVDGLALRVGAKIDKPCEGSEAYRYAPLTTIANMLLPESDKSLNPMEVAERSLVTGDFPLLLQSVGARVLVSEFEKQAGTYEVWMRKVDVPDFRVMQDLTSSFGGGRLSKTAENGDLRELKGNEAKESWKIETFGNKFVLTREMLINDDLGAFTDLVSTFGEMAQTTANGIAYDILQGKGDYASYKMADGSGLFVGSRSNSATLALSSDALSAGRTAMSRHKSMDGKTPLRITPKFLIVAPELEVKAKEILGATSKLGADNVNVPNANQNLYTLVVDPEITSPTAWYLLAERRTFKMGFLAGTNRKPIIKKNDSSVLRVVFEGIFDIGVMAEDYKGLYRGNV